MSVMCVTGNSDKHNLICKLVKAVGISWEATEGPATDNGERPTATCGVDNPYPESRSSTGIGLCLLINNLKFWGMFAKHSIFPPHYGQLHHGKSFSFLSFYKFLCIQIFHT